MSNRDFHVTASSLDQSSEAGPGDDDAETINGDQFTITPAFTVAHGSWTLPVAQSTDAAPTQPAQADHAAHFLPPEDTQIADAAAAAQSAKEQSSRLAGFVAGKIQRDVLERTVIVRPDETLLAVARRHLGQGATEADVEQAVADIRRLNFKRNEGVTAGEKLKLPGYSQEGSINVTDFQGTKFSFLPDKSRRVEYKDRTGYIASGQTETGTTERHFGPKPADNFEIRFDAQGNIDRAYRPGDAPPLSLESERDKLKNVADRKILIGREREQFDKDMKTFEARAGSIGMDTQEVARSYRDIARLLETNGQEPLTDRKRVRVATGFMRNVAEPTSNDQGDHGTCNVTSLENRLYTRWPSDVSRMLADIGITGKYISGDGSTVFLHPGNALAYGEEARNDARGSNNRQYVSQIFQTTAVNLFYARFNESGTPPSGYRYEQTRPGETTTGERIVDYSNNPPKVIAADPEHVAYPNGLQKVMNQITGRNERDVVLGHAAYRDAGSLDTAHFSSPEQLAQMLIKLKSENRLPAIMSVRARSGPLYNELSDEKKKFNNVNEVLADGHIVGVIDYDPVTRMVKVDNQWGNSSDYIEKPLSLDDFYVSTKPATANVWLDRLEAERRRSGDNHLVNKVALLFAAYRQHWDQRANFGELTDEEVQDRRRAIDRFKPLMDSINSPQSLLLKTIVLNALPEHLR